MKKILGIDPGSRVTGYGVLAVEGGRFSYVASGCIRVAHTQMQERLAAIFSNLSDIISRYQPETVAIEQVFLGKNVSSALKLGQARGAAMVAVAQQQKPLFEYAPRTVKQAVVGRGQADKGQVQQMVALMLKLPKAPPADAADALAIALCHAQTYTHPLLNTEHLGKKGSSIKRGRVQC